MKVSVTLSANAGVAIHIGGYRIWVDALHTDRQPGFSAVDVPLQKRMLQCDAFAKPDFILYTHCHPDHFSEKLTRSAQNLWPEAEILLPEKYLAEQILVSGGEFIHRLGDLTLRFFRLPHDGEQYADCIHYGLTITVGGKTVLIPGDCKTAATELAQVISGESIDLALLNFPWLTLKRGQDFVNEYLKASHILLYHLPFTQDDTFGYRQAAQKAAQKLPGTQMLWEPLQTLVFEI